MPATMWLVLSTLIELLMLSAAGRAVPELFQL